MANVVAVGVAIFSIIGAEIVGRKFRGIKRAAFAGWALGPLAFVLIYFAKKHEKDDRLDDFEIPFKYDSKMSQIIDAIKNLLGSRKDNSEDPQGLYNRAVRRLRGENWFRIRDVPRAIDELKCSASHSYQPAVDLLAYLKSVSFDVGEVVGQPSDSFGLKKKDLEKEKRREMGVIFALIALVILKAYGNARHEAYIERMESMYPNPIASYSVLSNMRRVAWAEKATEIMGFLVSASDVEECQTVSTEMSSFSAENESFNKEWREFDSQARAYYANPTAGKAAYLAYLNRMQRRLTELMDALPKNPEGKFLERLVDSLQTQLAMRVSVIATARLNLSLSSYQEFVAKSPDLDNEDVQRSQKFLGSYVKVVEETGYNPIVDK